MSIQPPEDTSQQSAPRRPEDPITRKKIEPRISLKKAKKSEDFIGFAKDSTKDTIAYIFLVIGFLLLFFEPLYGGTILGILFGLYFSAECVEFWRKSQEWMEEWGMVKTLVIAGILLSFFVSSLGSAVILAVAVITMILKQLFLPDVAGPVKKDFEKEE